MRNATVWTMAGLSAVLALGACHNRPGTRHGDGDLDRDHDERGRDHDERGDEHVGRGDARPAGPEGVKAHKAVHAIAKARCDREQRCDNIGADKKFASEAACEESIRADWADLNKYECPRGIDQPALDQCLTDVRSEDCNSPLDTLARLTNCNVADICED